MTTRLGLSVCAVAVLAGCMNDLFGADNAPILDNRPPDAICKTFGTKQCKGRMQQTCNAALSWETNVECPYVCRDGGCVGECEPNALRCKGRERQRCGADGSWHGEAVCDKACLEGGQCGGVCVPDTLSCANVHTLQVCTNEGTWVPNECINRACLDGRCVGECSPGTFSCGVGTTKTRLECTETGTWAFTTPCPFLCAGQGQCGGVCDPGAHRCAPDRRTRETCNDDGAWVGTACPAACAGGECTGVCVPESERCAPGHEIQGCDDQGQWTILKKRCDFVCLPPAATCSGECKPDSSKCLDATNAAVCGADGRWSPKSCAPGACSNERCTGVCTPMQTSCMGGNVFRCQSNGQWALDVACSQPGMVCKPGSTPACGPNPTEFEGNNVTPGTAAMISGNVIYLTRVQIGNKPIDVDRFGLVGPPSATGLTARAALYSDKDGWPSDRLTTVTGLLVGPARQTAAHPTCQIVEANKTVWLALLIPVQTSVSWGMVSSPGQKMVTTLMTSPAVPFPNPIDRTMLNVVPNFGLSVFLETRERHVCP